jgi:hypothetical protein
MQRVVTGGDNDTRFEETLKLEPGGEQTVADAFAMPDDEETYSVNARFEQMVDSEFSYERNDGFVFQPGGYGTPTGDVVVELQDRAEGEALRPAITVQK